ncbi:alpha/beta hydrolase family protein [Bosea sp. 2RAB26]|uniref:alpha/beta hydrolase family protein n=1 Tax=Bosea sp. 2RAB26 TaxID=3237476 RepID=UPI003F8E4C49
MSQRSLLQRSLLMAGAWLLTTVLAHSADAIGFRQTTLDMAGKRPLQVSLWYPTKQEARTEIVGDNPAFHGVPVIRGAAPLSGHLPLVVLSHGYGGSWRNLAWLAAELAARGSIVAAPDHPGTTTFDMPPAQAAMLWERPRDLSRVIDAVERDSTLAGKVDISRVAAIGHSLGGWTVAELAGARFDTKRFETDCKANTSPRVCVLRGELGLDKRELEGNLADPRLKAFVSLDLGLARGFTPESLASLDMPALVIGAGIDIDGLPAKFESGYLAEHLPKPSATSVTIPDATHFAFVGLCKPDAVALIEKVEPGSGMICRDDGPRGRDEIHREIAFLVIGFLARSIPVRP